MYIFAISQLLPTVVQRLSLNIEKRRLTGWVAAITGGSLCKSIFIEVRVGSHKWDAVFCSQADEVPVSCRYSRRFGRCDAAVVDIASRNSSSVLDFGACTRYKCAGIPKSNETANMLSAGLFLCARRHWNFMVQRALVCAALLNRTLG